jgi:hypothetical protein
VGKEDLFVRMVVYIKDKLLMICLMELVNFNMQIKINILVNLIKELEKDKDNIFIVKEQHLVGFGRMIRKFKEN